MTKLHYTTLDYVTSMTAINVGNAFLITISSDDFIFTMYECRRIIMIPRLYFYFSVSLPGLYLCLSVCFQFGFCIISPCFFIISVFLPLPIPSHLPLLLPLPLSLLLLLPLHSLFSRFFSLTLPLPLLVPVPLPLSSLSRR